MSHRRRPWVLPAVVPMALLTATIMIPGANATARTRSKPVTATCTSWSGVINGTPTPTVNGCSPAPNAVGPGTMPGLSGPHPATDLHSVFPCSTPGFTGQGVTIDWSNGATTSFQFVGKAQVSCIVKKGADVPNPRYHCPNFGLTDGAELFVHSQIQSQTTVPGDAGLKGGISAKICVNVANGSFLLLAGTKFKA
jgi:hypothetical protein